MPLLVLLFLLGFINTTAFIHTPPKLPTPGLLSGSRSTRFGMRCSTQNGAIPEGHSFLKLDSGQRISRIITVSTSSYEAMLKLGMARTRNEIMKACMVTHKQSSMLTEHPELPLSTDGMHKGWSFEPRAGSPIKACSGVSGSVLWAIDIQTSTTSRVALGSWLMGTVSLTGDDFKSSLFTKSSSRLENDLQPVTLTRPGVAKPELINTEFGPQFILNFIELQHCDELGIPTRRRF